MPTPTLKLKSVGIIAEVNDVLHTATHYLAADDAHVQRLLHEAQATIHANAAEAYNAMGSVYQLIGDYEKSRYNIDNAIKLAPSNYVYLLNKSACLINLGFFTEAQRIFDRLAKPELGFFTHAWNQGYVCGAFASMERHLQKAQVMGLDLQGLDTKTAARAARVLDKAGVADSDIGSVLDTAGALLREQRLFYIGEVPSIRVFDGPDENWFVEMSYDVGISPSEAHALYKKFVDQIVHRDSKASFVLSVSFRSRGMNHERSAA